MFARKLTFVLICLASLAPEQTIAQGLQHPMKDAYLSFKELQYYLKDSDTFGDPRNTQIIRAQLNLLKTSFHKVERVDSAYKGEPGFLATLSLVNEMLDDAAKRFAEDRKAYAFWRLRTLSNHCVTCHATYNAKLFFQDKDEAPKNLSDIEKAEFYFSTRQYPKASELLTKALKESKEGYPKLELLRRWLLLQTRAVDNPKEAYTSLRKLVSDLKLAPAEREEVTDWISSLKKWSEEEKGPRSVAEAERIIREAHSEDPLFNRVDAVGLLRGTALLHSLLTEKSLKDTERARALYLLGLGYNELSLFLIDELPEMYLELCIEEFGGSEEAKSAFKLYEEIVAVRFSGSGGSHIPSDVAVRIMELYKKANGIPEFEGRV